ncbi:MAG: isoleucine--tRNA ligase [Phycisphaerales bacterium]|jgi:isoleucyl-tRNA synthetase|nr:isoleucine--tRNA ligase [Phycisphaerales bacterium]MBT7170600.1 isoleucine--tRNA ligase [Phycisphaerales bacterium]
MGKKNQYKATLNLPKTSFDMRAGLLTKEPATQQRWTEEDLYGQIREARKGSERFILHDGPPYANGNIHIGHVLNKVLKDLVIRTKTMAGFDAPFIPGWDCHGLPIEAKVMEKLGEKAKTLDAVVIRRICREYAEKFVTLQSDQFERLGCYGEFDDPYITMDPGYESATLGVFAQLIERGLVFRQLKPVHWSIANQTALAEAELEYQDRTDTSIFVAFDVVAGLEAIPHTPGDTVGLLIWTTTPWTLPANRAVAVGPNIEYVAVRTTTPDGPMTVVCAAELLEKVKAAAEDGWLADAEIVGTVRGEDLASANIQYAHPLSEGMTCPLVAADYVTLEDGTGLVHTAPGHGTDDYFTGLKNGLETYCPVLADGMFDATVPGWLTGKSVWDGNTAVIEFLRNKARLVSATDIEHSYPHDWRSKTPTIFRATEQWFIGVDRPLGSEADAFTLRSLAQDVTGKPLAEGGVDFIPDWGRNRLGGMLESRPDWCVSRQRSWGLPIPAFFTPDGDVLCTAETVRTVAACFGEHGSDAWYTMTPAEILSGYDLTEDDAVEDASKFDLATLTKGGDIFDVWFESGSSWAAVAKLRGLVEDIPVDLYLEGSDQHRGWFQLSLLPALGAQGVPPFKTVLTHGFINDAEGKKMSKSLGNGVDVQEQLSKRGADILRLWVASQDYRDDDRCSDELIAQCEDTYRKIRNTIRFCLGSIGDYNPADGVCEPAEHSLDRWMRLELELLIRDVRGMFDRYEFHVAMRRLFEFCTVQVSSVYLAAIKDRLYCELPNSPRRRATQGVLRDVVVTLIKLLAPIIPFTAEEAWASIPHADEAEPKSVHLSILPQSDADMLEIAEDIRPVDHKLLTEPDLELVFGPGWIWERLMDLRSKALVKLEDMKAAGVKNSMDAEVVFAIPENLPGLRTIVESYLPELEDLCGVGFARIEAAEAVEDAAAGVESIAVSVVDTRESYECCERSWKRRPDVGSDAAYPTLSARDAAVVAELGFVPDSE